MAARMSIVKDEERQGAGGRRRSADHANQRPVPDRPKWLVTETALDGTPRYFVRLPVSEQAIGEPSYFGPFRSEETAHTFETKAYNRIMEAITETRGLASDLHEDEIRLSNGEPEWC